ncbi:MAG: hypothetical protein AB1505_22660 [Candidatus Latescibacterota bacterium]
MTGPLSDPRALLEGDLLHIGFHGTGKASYPEDIVTPAVYRALAQHLRIDLHTEGEFWGDYCYFAGVTGEAFRFLEFLDFVGPARRQPSRPWVERYGHMTAVQMHQHALAAAGLTAEVHVRPRFPEMADLRQRIVASLRDRQTPVIGIGAFGPPESFLVTGYADNGDVLLGWSHFQAEKKDDPRVSFEPSGQFRLRDWYEAVDGLVIVTGRRDLQEPAAVYRATLARALPELGTTGTDAEPLGTAALARWAARLEDEDAFAGWTDE